MPKLGCSPGDSATLKRIPSGGGSVLVDKAVASSIYEASRFGPVRANAISYEETTVQAVDGRQQGSPHTTTSVFFVRRPDRTPPAQDIQLETPAEYAVGGDLDIAAHLRLRASLFTGC